MLIVNLAEYNRNFNKIRKSEIFKQVPMYDKFDESQAKIYKKENTDHFNKLENLKFELRNEISANDARIHNNIKDLNLKKSNVRFENFDERKCIIHKNNKSSKKNFIDLIYDFFNL